jgi:predicted molibdopterin-dependent oxidoreductase YjgC
MNPAAHRASVVALVVDGRPVQAREGESLLRVLRREGFAVPSLCWHEKLSPYGACRLCLVETRRGRKARLATSCDYPALDGVEVRTDTPEIRAQRQTVVRLLLAMAPAAPVVRDLAARHGVDAAALEATKAGDCILCGLCVRVCAEAVGASAVAFQSRGEAKAIGAPWDAPSAACVSCGACASVCPVDARATLSRVIRRLCHEGAGEHRCRWAMLGLFSDGVCANRYECERCEVEHRVRDRLADHPAFLLRRGTVAGDG